MQLLSLRNRVPSHSYSQSDCWDILQRSRRFAGLKERSRQILSKVLKGDGGIERRHFAMPDVDRLFDLGPGELNEGFEREAPALAAESLREALDDAGMRADELDGLIVCTCTGYLCPGISSHVAEVVGLRPDAFLTDVVGLGCGAAIPTLRQAEHFLAAHPGARVACIAVEICSAAFYLDDDPGVLVSLCLFGDGASASIWAAEGEGRADVHGFRSLHLPEDRELLRFVNAGGHLKNRLSKVVPERAGLAVSRLWRESDSPPGVVLAHPGGRDVVEAVESVLGGHPLEASRKVLRENGNMSSPSVLFVLGEWLSARVGGDEAWLVSFGAGFSVHGVSVRRNGG